MLRYFLSRQAHDTIAAAAHFASVALIIHGFGKFPSFALTGLFLMQVVSFCFHLFYVIVYIEQKSVAAGRSESLLRLLFPRNKLKWLEYGISATAGAVAVIYANGLPTPGYIVALVCMSALQQFLGSIIDSFLQRTVESINAQEATGSFLWVTLLITLASCLQVGEFVIVSYAGSPPFEVFVSYVIGWSLFGVHCIIQANVVSQLALDAALVSGTGRVRSSIVQFFLTRYRDRNWVEAVYSCLGWAAKLAVFSTEYVYLKENREESDELTEVAVGFGVFALLVTGLTVSVRPMMTTYGAEEYL